MELCAYPGRSRPRPSPLSRARRATARPTTHRDPLVRAQVQRIPRPERQSNSYDIRHSLAGIRCAHSTIGIRRVGSHRSQLRNKATFRSLIPSLKSVLGTELAHQGGDATTTRTKAHIEMTRDRLVLRSGRDEGEEP